MRRRQLSFRGGWEAELCAPKAACPRSFSKLANGTSSFPGQLVIVLHTRPPTVEAQCAGVCLLAGAAGNVDSAVCFATAQNPVPGVCCRYVLSVLLSPLHLEHSAYNHAINSLKKEIKKKPFLQVTFKTKEEAILNLAIFHF